MYTRHDDVPVFESCSGSIEANTYNQVRLALTRLQPELRLSLPGLKHLDLILQDDAWVIVDRLLNDVPVVAWSHFDIQHRTGLHMPVACRVRLYHANADAILHMALAVMQDILHERLHPHGNHKVVPLPPPRSH